MNNYKIDEKGIYRKYDSSAIQLISVWPKVLQIIRGEIPVPEVVEIFPTNFCNFACPHCRFLYHHGDKEAYINLALFEKLMDELNERSVSAIELSGGGEVLVHPEIERIFDHINYRGFRVGLITNGYSFSYSDTLINKASKCCNWIRFSLDAFSEDTFKRVHGKKDISYKKLKKAIHDLGNMTEETPKIGIKILISRINYRDALLAISESINMGADYLQYKFLGFPSELALMDQEIEKLTKEITQQIASVNDLPLVAELVPTNKGQLPQKCLMSFLHPVVDWDGEIYICAFFEHRKKKHSIGNIHNGGFFKHWDSAYHKEAFESIDPKTCIPNCPMTRYNPVIEFIKSDWYRFQFI